MGSIGAYYPGDDYIDWLGFSVYGVQYQDEDWHSFNSLMLPAYNKICTLSSKKPVLLAEWGVGEYPAKGDKAAWYAGALSSLPTEYPRVRIDLLPGNDSRGDRGGKLCDSGPVKSLAGGTVEIS